ncbi:hypothetical protein D3C87_1186800 [compost metagenome]
MQAAAFGSWRVPDRLIDQQIMTAATGHFFVAADAFYVGAVVVVAELVFARQLARVFVNQLDRHHGAGGVFWPEVPGTAGVAVAFRVDVERGHAQLPGRRQVVFHPHTEARIGVVGPAAAAGHVQRMAAETGVHEVAQNAAVEAAEVVAHGHVAEFHIECWSEQRALVTQFGQARVQATVVFLDRQSVADEVFGGAVAATIVDGQLDLAGIVDAVQFAQVELHAELDVLRVTRRAMQTTVGVVGHFAAVVAGELDALFIHLVTQATPVTSEGAAGQQIGIVVGQRGEGGGARQAQQQAFEQVGTGKTNSR